MSSFDGFWDNMTGMANGRDDLMLGSDGQIARKKQHDADVAAMMPTTDQSMTDEAVVEGVMGVQDPMQEQAEQAFAEGIEEQKELELVRIGGGLVGLPISAALAGADLLSLPILLSEGVITAEEGEIASNILKQFENMPSAYVGAQLKDAIAGMGFAQETVDAFGEGYLAGELLAITSSALPGLKLLGKGATKLKEGFTNYAAGAEARIAERGSGITLQSGVDPMAAVDEAIVAGQKLTSSVQPQKPEGITLEPASDTPRVGKLDPDLRVTVAGFEPVKGAGVVIKMTPQNFQQSSQKLDEIATEFPDPLASPETYALMTAKVKNSKEVQAPPNWLIEHSNDPEKFADWFNKLSPEQIKAADEGLQVQERFKNAYQAGAGADLTAQLMLWSILSRSLSAFPHESGYKDLAVSAKPYIQKAIDGSWTDADSQAWRQTVSESIPVGSPGRSATSNANDFGELFLKKMSVVDETGKTKLQQLHEMVSDPNISSVELRRKFYGLAEGTGIKNKILSFALLVSGRNDVVVMDRIQINRMFAGGDNIYDRVVSQFDDAHGLAHYEALERALSTRVDDLYQRVGRGDQASVGRYHWESWVLSSSQVVSHPTLEAVVRASEKVAEPAVGVPVKEGRYHQFLYGAEYEKLPGGGFRYVYRTSDGVPYEFSKPEIDEAFKEIKSKKSGVLPPDFPGVNSFKGGNMPWFEYEGVDRGKLDEIIRARGKQVE